MKIDKDKVEREAARAVERCIDRCPRLEPQIWTNDKNKTWDGEIRINSTDKHQVGSLFDRVPLQIKGTTDTRYDSYRLHRKYIEEYQTDGGSVLFVVHEEVINSEYNTLKVLYSMLSLNDVNTLLEQKTKTIKINLKEFPSNRDVFENELISFATKRKRLPNENPAPSEIASLVYRFKDLKNHLDMVNDVGKEIELGAFIDKIMDLSLENDGTIGWRDRFIYLSRNVLNYFIQYVPEYDTLDLQIELGNYLCQQKLYHKVGDFYSRALDECRERAKTSFDYNVHVAGILNNLAILHLNNHQLSDAESELKEALEIYIRLDKDSPNVARTRNHLAILHKHVNELEAAEIEYKNALHVYRKLAKDNPSVYLADVAMTLNNLGILHRNINNFTAAEDEYKEALEIYIKLAKDNPNAYLAKKATTLNNLAVLHCVFEPNAAEREYIAALKILKRLATDNPKTYLPDVAMTLNNLGLLHSGFKTDAAKEAAKNEYKLALEIYRKLAEVNPDAYSCYIAITLNHLGLIHWKCDQNEYKTAKYHLEEALEILRKLVKDNPDSYLADLATTLHNIGIVNKYLCQRKDAENAYNDALMIRLNLAEANPDAYMADVAETLFNIALLLIQDEQRKDEAKQKCEKALIFFKTMAKKAPQRFKKDMDKAQKLLDVINNL